MDKDEEIALASAIVSHEERAWQAALSYPPILGWVKKLVHELVEEPPSFSAVESAAAAARASRRKSDRERLQRTARRLAARLRDRDRDHLALDEMVVRLPEIADDPEVRRSLRSKAFLRCMLEIESASAAAAEARHQFVQANLRLVVHVATKYTGYGVPFDDLIQDGNLGLLKAVDRFDHRRGNRFSTYATWWIHHTIGRGVADTSRTVRVPVHVRDTHQRAVKATRELSRKLGRPPTDEEIAAELGISIEKLRFAKNNLRGTNVSLDEPVGEDAETARQEVFAMPNAGEVSAADETISRSTVAQLQRRLGALTEKEADIIRSRFGLENRPVETLQQIADRYGLSRERIRQLEAQALEKLRRHLDESEERGWSSPR